MAEATNLCLSHCAGQDLGHLVGAGSKGKDLKGESGAPGEIRTPDLLLRRQSLYPSELRAPAAGFSLHARFRTINARVEAWKEVLESKSCANHRRSQFSAAQWDAPQSRRKSRPAENSELTSVRVRPHRHPGRRDLRHGLRGLVRHRPHVQSWVALRSH